MSLCRQGRGCAALALSIRVPNEERVGQVAFDTEIFDPHTPKAAMIRINPTVY